MKVKEKTVKLPHKCMCGSNKGRIDIEQDDGYKLYILKCVCGYEFDHSLHKELLGRKAI